MAVILEANDKHLRLLDLLAEAVQGHLELVLVAIGVVDSRLELLCQACLQEKFC